MSADRAHRSIGEVLSLLQDDFPDVTISKIRFLESQGLLEPERTPSGYRKFFDPDVDRLRWILVHQRDHFLPLKVIKERLDGGAFDEWVAAGADPAAIELQPVQPALELVIDEPPAPLPAPPPTNGSSARPSPAPPSSARSSSAPPVPDAAVNPSGERSGSAGEEPVVDDDPHRFDAILSSARRVATPSVDEPATEQVEVVVSDEVGDEPSTSERDVGDAEVPEPPAELDAGPLDPGAANVSMTVDELSRASGLTPLELAELARYGLLASRPVGPAVYYDGEALVVAKLSAAFLCHGIEARHLRMYKTAAEREAGVFEQVVAPLVGRHDGASRREARERLVEMARLGEALHAALLRTSLRGYGEGS